MKKGKLWTGVIICSLVYTIGCSKTNTASNASGGGGGSQLLNDKPFIKCAVTNTGDGTTIMSVSNLTQASDFPLPPIQGVTIGVNCGQSVASDGSAVITTLSVNGGAPRPLTSTYNQTFPNPGTNVFTVSVTDAKGLISSTSFTIPVSCNPLSYAPITLGGMLPAAFTTGGSIAFSAGANGPGYVNAVLPAAAGGSGAQGYNYAIDLNGDGRFDDYMQTYWNTSTAFSNMYTLYNGTRNVNVTVLDVACSMEQRFTLPVDYTTILDPIQTGVTATAGAYHYVQAQVDALGLTPSGAEDMDLADTVHVFDAMEGPIDNPQIHVLCDWDGTNLNVWGANTYSDGNKTTTESELQQGLALAFSDQGAIGTGGANAPSQTNLTPPTVNYTNAPTTKLVYQTAASPDGTFNQYTFNQDSNGCTTTGQIIYKNGIVPCTTGIDGTNQGVKNIQVQILGTFTCPHLTAPAVSPDPNKRTLKITNGYYFCEVAPINQCFGGGGQGGGGVAPPTF